MWLPLVQIPSKPIWWLDGVLVLRCWVHVNICVHVSCLELFASFLNFDNTLSSMTFAKECLFLCSTVKLALVLLQRSVNAVSNMFGLQIMPMNEGWLKQRALTPLVHHRCVDQSQHMFQIQWCYCHGKCCINKTMKNFPRQSLSFNVSVLHEFSTVP